MTGSRTIPREEEVTKKAPSAPRCAAFVGPYTSGKTTLLESLLFVTGAVPRKGSVKDKSTVGDSSPEARARQMTTEINLAGAEYLGERWTFIDCPGSVELLQETENALMVCDVAVVVCDPVPERALTVAPLLKFLDDHAIPHLIFVNKMDSAGSKVRATLEALQSVSERPLILREVPIRDGEAVTGYVDLVSERAFKWTPGKPSEMISLPATMSDEEKLERGSMLEHLADFDDHLLEELLEDSQPPTDEIYDNLTRDLQQDLIVPVFFGAAEKDHGVRRLLKALRHEAPEVAQTAERNGVASSSNEGVAQVFKTLHGAHAGKLSVVRVWKGEIADGTTFGENRVGGIFRLFGAKEEKLAKAAAGDIVAFGRLDGAKTGQILSASGKGGAKAWPDPLPPLFALAIHAEKRGDDVKLSSTLTKLVEEDPSLSFGHSPDTGEFLLWGQGEVHLQIAVARLSNRNHLELKSHRPQIPYKETIRKGTVQHARHKKQSGGHGEFGDIHVEIKPLPRGSGFKFVDAITGGVVPRQYIPAVETGIKESLERGPLGFTVVDVEVKLTDGQFHTVDSSDMAFRKAAHLAIREGMPKCEPVLLEPIFQVEIAVPNDFTARAQRIVTGRRGQVLGYDARDGWKGWDEVKAMLPQSEMHDLIVELRSLTMGVGTFTGRFDHLQELTGRPADQVVAQRAQVLGPHPGH